MLQSSTFIIFVIIKVSKLCLFWRDRWHTPLIPELGKQRQVDFWIQGQSGLQSEFQDSQRYTEKPCLEKKKSPRPVMPSCLPICFTYSWGYLQQNLQQAKSKQTSKQTPSLFLHAWHFTCVLEMWLRSSPFVLYFQSHPPTLEIEILACSSCVLSTGKLCN